MSPVSGSNVFAAHGCKPQSSSLRKIPRYFTDGGPTRSPCARTSTDVLFFGGRSADLSQGYTTIHQHSRANQNQTRRQECHASHLNPHLVLIAVSLLPAIP